MAVVPRTGPNSDGGGAKDWAQFLEDFRVRFFAYTCVALEHALYRSSFLAGSPFEKGVLTE